MPLTTRIDLPAPVRVGGGLLSASRPLPSGWERGIQFNGSSCVGPQAWPYCLSEEVSPGEKVPVTLSDVAEFMPGGIFQAVECTTFSQDRARSSAVEALSVTAEWQMGRELQTGETTDNPSLTDGTLAGSAADYVTALGVLDQAISNGLFGRLGFIHVSPGDMAHLVSAQVIIQDGRTWRSPAGHVVVSSPGYDFGGELHATGEVFASVSVPETRVDIDRAINQTVAYAEQIGLAAFDPCFNVYVEVTS